MDAKNPVWTPTTASPLRHSVFRADGAPVPPEEATRIWRELALGQWQVLDATDTEGTRHVAIAPLTKPPIRWEVLRYRERQVLALATRGTSQKLIAAELGVAATTVSEILRGVRSRLGFASVAHLLRAYEASQPHPNR
ncbi:MAG: helix-turn-helix transcriptional regulator [Polyangiaceae bacterium]|jgi:DNA-binding CsgD family transcriptional regulator